MGVTTQSISINLSFRLCQERVDPDGNSLWKSDVKAGSVPVEPTEAQGIVYVCTVADVTEAPLGTFDALPAWLEGARERQEEWGVPHPQAPEVPVARYT